MAPKKEALATRNLIMARIHDTLDLAQAALSDSAKVTSFKIKYRRLDQSYLDFEKIHIDIIAQISSDAELMVQDQIRKEIDIAYDEILNIYEELFPIQCTSTQSDLNVHSSSPAFSSPVAVKLPTLELMKFSGDLKQWQTFIDIFNSSVHDNVYISDINKFQYLLTSLVNEPLTLVKSIPLTATNYQIAYDTLVKRYSNKRLLMQHHWHALKNYPVLTTDNYKALRTLIDTFSENIAILNHLGCNIKEWDFILTDILLYKLDSSTRTRFELSCDATLIPKYEDVKDFLLKQCNALETVGSLKSSNHHTTSQRSNKPSSNQAFYPTYSKDSKGHPFKSCLVNATKPSSSSSLSYSNPSYRNQSSHSDSEACILCNMNHSIHRCPSFLSKSPSDRFQVAKQAHLCINCLRQSHRVSNCQSQHTCRSCGHKHHSLLHFEQSSSNKARERSNSPAYLSQQSSFNNGSSNQNQSSFINQSTNANQSSITNQPHRSSSSSPSAGVHACTSVSSENNSSKTTVLLATVSFEIKNKLGNYCTIRALLDPGSQASFIIDSSVKQLGLPRLRNQTPIFGLGQSTSHPSTGITTCHIRPRGSNGPLLAIDALILKSICFNIPSSPVDTSQLDFLNNLQLADPCFNTPGPIHMLLGADIYPSLLKGHTITHDNNAGPMAIETIFGWTLLGPIHNQTSSNIRSFFTSIEPCSDAVLKRFWDVEEVPSKPISCPEDDFVENHYQNSHFRISTGRFGVALPFKMPSPHFENSRAIADRRFMILERRLQSKASLRGLYFDFMQDYLDSGHMSLLNPTPNAPDTYFIPHHIVLTGDGDSQKLRVVFDASAKADNSLSLNDTLYPGPKLQSDISVILLRFRLHPIVFICDIRQMYRQILVTPEHRRYQLIRFRFRPTEPIQTYQLNTVTYGVNSSPYLAIRTLLQLAEEGNQQFPLAAAALKTDIYVDDLVCGASSVEAALTLRNQLISLLQSACLELRKWSSNHPMMLEDIPISHRQQQNLSFDNESDTIKVLGIQWHSSSDSFSFKVTSRDSPCTKRSILSEVARIYDPLGFLSPLTLFAKRILQHLWSRGLDWDDTPPEDVKKVWLQYKSEILCLRSLRIPRFLFDTSLQSCQLHAFCDASEDGYSCVIYFRIVDIHHQVSTKLVMAKSKVAPLKRLSIPRLELCAAVLLSKLVDFVINTYQSILTFDHIITWCDSTVALTWIRASPCRWKTFVANRVTFIQERIPPSCWRYIPSNDNPADPASRGLLPSDMLSCSLWWAGPDFLLHPPERWPLDSSAPHSPTDVLEEKAIVFLAQTLPSEILNLCDTFSSLRKIQGIVAYILRFTNNSRAHHKVVGPLSNQELHQALLRLVKLVQFQVFPSEILAIQQNKKCPKYLQKLSPFLDADGILRVGGRITNADLSFSAKHPAILPRKHYITDLIIEQTHLRNLHSGVNTTLYLVQQNFWILSARRAIRHSLSLCNRCFRTNPIATVPLMGDLPKTRISQLKPFSCVGVDYAGPFSITLGKTRGARKTKAYLCLFICFATKAIHLELASDLSTDAFIGALRRFIARRGRCSRLFSDCGTNFIGAHRELNKYMQTSAEAENILWTFNPPSAPHFGGLWESGIKAVKTHFYRVIGDQLLTYEEMNTLFVQIESLLNSRPLCTLSSDPNDLNVLTPGHFLTLEPLTSAPDPDLCHLSINRLSRWQLVQQMHQRFWTRWKNEYLHTLYQRSKWSTSYMLDPIDIGTLVLIKDNIAPPLKWRLGRILELHPGKDGIARVATVSTSQGTFKRPLVKLCALPSQ